MTDQPTYLELLQQPIIVLELINPLPAPERASADYARDCQYGATLYRVRIDTAKGHMVKVKRTLVPYAVMQRLKRRHLHVHFDDEWYYVFSVADNHPTYGLPPAGEPECCVVPTTFLRPE